MCFFAFISQIWNQKKTENFVGKFRKCDSVKGEFENN